MERGAFSDSRALRAGNSRRRARPDPGRGRTLNRCLMVLHRAGGPAPALPVRLLTHVRSQGTYLFSHARFTGRRVQAVCKERRIFLLGSPGFPRFGQLSPKTKAPGLCHIPANPRADILNPIGVRALFFFCHPQRPPGPLVHTCLMLSSSWRLNKGNVEYGP